MKNLRLSIVLLAWVGVFVLPYSIEGHTIHVPADYPTIKAGISAASSGDTVLVAAGTYHENNIHMKAGVVIKGVGIDSSIVDGDGETVFWGADDATLEGFTITGASGSYEDGIFCWSTTPTIYNNKITNCYSAISVADNAIIRNNIIFDNSDYGIFCGDNSPVITRNLIVDSDGAIISVSSDLIAYNNTVLKNERGLWIQKSSDDVTPVEVTAINNIISSNSWYGVYLSSSPSYGVDPAYMTIMYNDVWNNSPNYSDNWSPDPSDISQDPLFANPGLSNRSLNRLSALEIEKVIKKDKMHYDIKIAQNEEFLKSGAKKSNEKNIIARNKFLLLLQIDPSDYYLQADSPCIDAGDPNSPLDPDGTRADMGAYYYNQSKTFDPIVVVDQINFEFFSTGSTIQKTFEVRNPNSVTITLISCVFDNTYFSLLTSLPIMIAAGSSSVITTSIKPASTALYQSNCQLTYKVAGESRTTTGQISVGLFHDDDSELAYIAHLALDAYNDCKAKDPNSIATKNNLGVLYRLLGRSDLAKQIFYDAVNDALNAYYGYSGIKMNIGVAKSDQDSSTGAVEYYEYALDEVSSDESKSVIAPQIYYNKAWEAYVNDNLSESLTQVNKTISHSKTNDFLKAKAYVLRGAIRYSEGNLDNAINDFQEAISLDPDGPIGRMAQDNLNSITAEDFTYTFSKQGWYFISLPVTPADNSLSALFPTSLGAFGYNANTGTYFAVTTLEPQKGYWLLIPSATSVTIEGTALTAYTEHYSPGWHLIGAVNKTTDFTDPDDSPDGSVIAASGWEPEASKYYQVYPSPPGSGELEPKEAYWLAVFQACDLTIGERSGTKAKVADNGDREGFYKQFGSQPPLPPFITDKSIAQLLPITEMTSHNNPNPFNSETVIEYALHKAGLTRITIYNALGQRIIVLQEKEQVPGTYKVIWNGQDNNGNFVPSGIYFYRIINSGLVETRKMVLLK